MFFVVFKRLSVNNANFCCYRYGGLDVRRKNATRESTATLKAWLYEHIKNPYPTKGEKIMLAIITKMTLTQVSTWFANARRRLKKENKMQWSPRNRNGEDDDKVNSDDDDDDKDLDDKERGNGLKREEDEDINIVDPGREIILSKYNAPFEPPWQLLSLYMVDPVRGRIQSKYNLNF